MERCRIAVRCQSTRQSHGELVTGQLVTRSTRHAVDASQRGGQLVTSNLANKQANIKAVLPQPQQYNYPYQYVSDRRHYSTRNSSGDEIANVNFLYDDIVHVLQNTIDSCIPPQVDAAVMCGTHVYQIQ